MSDHGLLSSYYEGRKERRTDKIRGAFSRMNRALDGWMLARAPASPAQGLRHHGPRYYFSFPYFCTMGGPEKLGLDSLIETHYRPCLNVEIESVHRICLLTDSVDRSCFGS